MSREFVSPVKETCIAQASLQVTFHALSCANIALLVLFSILKRLLFCRINLTKDY